jgi:hypothetical protein
MRRTASVLAGLALAAGPACASPLSGPEMMALAGQSRERPPEVAVLIVPSGDETSGELLSHAAPADGGGLLRLAEPAFTEADFEGCRFGVGVDPETCIRSRLAEGDAAAIAGPPTVVILLRPGPGFYIGWTCIGVGERPTAADRQTVYLDWQPNMIEASAREAAGCILAAAAESGG